MFKTIKTFYSFISIRKYWYALFVFLVVLHTTLSFAAPYFYKLFIERIQSNQLEGFVSLLLIYLAVQFSINIVSNFRFFSGDMVAVEAGIAARLKVFKVIQDLDFAYHTNKSTGSLISVIKRGDNALWTLYDRIHEQFAGAVVGFIILTVYLSTVDPRIIVIFLVSLIFTLLIIRFLMPMNIKTRNDFNDEEDKVAGIIADNMINYETVKLFAKEDWEYKRLSNNFKVWRKMIWKHFLTYRYIDFSLGNLINLSIFLILLIATNLISLKQIKISDFVLIITAVSMFFPKLFDVVYSIRNLSQGYADIKKYFEVLDIEILVKDPVNEKRLENVKGNIEFKNVNFTYDSKDENKKKRPSALKNINLHIKPGESIALVGRSGVGKTTLVRLLMRFFDVTSGEITIDGINIKDFSKSRLRSFMGVVPQEPILFNNTIGYNIAYGKENATQQEIAAAAKMANLEKLIQSLPDKYETQVGERGIKLSGGQKQRLAIARMILSNPDIVIFDEATSQLDSESEKLIQDAFWKAVKNKTTIIIAHRLSTIARADKIVVMEKGTIAEVGTHSELLKDVNTLYSHFWKLQINKK